MSSDLLRKFRTSPLRLGQYTKAFVLPAWWLRLNDNVDEFEISISLDAIEVRPVRRNTEVKEIPADMPCAESERG